MVCVSVGVSENGVKLEQDKQFRKEHKGVMGIVQEKHTVRMTLKQCKNMEKLKGVLQDSLPAFLDMLKLEGFTNGCELCGEAKETGAAYVAAIPSASATSATTRSARTRRLTLQMRRTRRKTW